MSLPASMSRCHDVACEVRELCRRWVERDHGVPQVVHQFTLRPTWQCHDEFCLHAIPLGTDQEVGASE